MFPAEEIRKHERKECAMKLRKILATYSDVNNRSEIDNAIQLLIESLTNGTDIQESYFTSTILSLCLALLMICTLALVAVLN